MRIAYKSGYKYQFCGTNLREDYENDIGIDAPDCSGHWVAIRSGRLIIRYGYAWDGASGPTFDTHTVMRASLEHDALYQLMRDGLLDQRYKAFADNRLEQCMIEDGASRIRARIWERALSIFGRRHTAPANRKPIKTAPKARKHV